MIAFPQMQYRETLAYLYSLTNYERVPLSTQAYETIKIDRMHYLLDALGNPHKQYHIIHVAGTKGKGSTCAMLASCLQRIAPKVGLYTSPHLSSFRERIQINCEPISKEEVCELAAEVRSVAQRLPDITTFEATTAMAFLHFARREVDWAVVEVGLGGRLDATNVVLPKVSVITSISFDHQHILGSTLHDIALEKAGIIKPGVPVVSQAQLPEAMAAIEQVARDQQASLTVIGRHWRWFPGSVSLIKQSFEVKKVAQVRTEAHPFLNDLEGWYEIPCLGRHQVENATTAIAVLDILRKDIYEMYGRQLALRLVRDGLWAVRWPGRFEILRPEPPVVLDGAHNLDSARKLVATLVEVFGSRRWTFVFGTLRDKDAAGMIAELSPRAGRWIMSQLANNPRAIPAHELLQLAQSRGVPAESVPDLEEAMRLALNSSSPVCVFGSVAFVGEARLHWAKHTGAPLPLTDEL
ncbi:MAG: bifunctional folylpolyglutamate synthase/dihydrofolate synthase [Thermoflexales bacterium]